MPVNSGDGSFGAKREYPTEATPASVAVGDVDGDRARDLVVATADEDASGSGAVAVLANDGDGASETVHVYPLGAIPPRSR